MSFPFFVDNRAPSHYMTVFEHRGDWIDRASCLITFALDASS